MFRVKVLAVIVAAACFVTPSRAELCTVDAVPASTVLIPYFEVNLNNLGPFGSTTASKLDNTQVTLINNSGQPILVHVAMWTNASLPTLNFDVPLTGFDEHDMDIDAIFNGVLPVPSGSPGSGCTECGVGGHERGFGCQNISPADGVTVDDLRLAHTGGSSGFYGGCMGFPTGNPNLATGYITMDVTNQCTRLFPNDSGYFENGGAGIATNDNFLTATIKRFSKKFLTEVPAIMIEAGTTDGLSTAGNYTFYGRYVQEDARDNRECGSNTWVFPFDTKSGLKTRAQVWRDSRQDFSTPLACGSQPSWFPLASSDRIIAYDDQENIRELDVSPFPMETQSVEVGKGDFKTPYTTGWIRLILGEQEGLQSYVIVNQRNRKRQSEAWAHYATSTICGDQNNDSAARRRSRRR